MYNKNHADKNTYKLSVKSANKMTKKIIFHFSNLYRHTFIIFQNAKIYMIDFIHNPIYFTSW